MSQRNLGLVSVLFALVVGGCGFLLDVDGRESGYVGISATENRELVVLIRVCNVPIKRVLAFRSGAEDPSNDPDGLANEASGEWSPKDSLTRGTHELNLASPGDRWQTMKKGDFEAAGRVYEIGADDTDNGFAAGVEASSEEIVRVRHNQVLVGEGRNHAVVTFAEFRARPCQTD